MTDVKLDVRAFLDQLNAFLADAYTEPRRLSDVLHAAGLSDDEVQQLRHTLLHAMLQGVRLRWCS